MPLNSNERKKLSSNFIYHVMKQRKRVPKIESTKITSNLKDSGESKIQCLPYSKTSTTIIRYSKLERLNRCGNILKYYVEAKMNQYLNLVTLLIFQAYFTLSAMSCVYKNEVEIITLLGHAFKIVFAVKWYQEIPVQQNPEQPG